MQCKQDRVSQKKKIFILLRILKSQEVSMNYCDRILNFEPDMMLKVKFGGFYGIWYSDT